MLLIELNKAREIRYGSVQRHFRKGYYVYIGSAMRNLRQRVHRHINYRERSIPTDSSGRVEHWHIDRLLVYGNIKTVLMLPNELRMEEELSGMVSKFFSAVPSFGATDCERVDSNLYCLRTVDDFYFITRKALELNWERKKGLVPES
jgi:Uri superfamily endonuclease